VTVTVANTAVRPVERTVSVVGTLAATAQAEVASEIEGRLVAIEADLGDRVHRDQVLARVREDEIQAKLREAEASLEKAAADEGRGRPLRGGGDVSRIGAASDPAVRSLAFEALVPNEDHRLRPGFFGHGEVVVRRDDRALAVPRSALSTFAGVTKVFVIEEGVAHERQVVLGVDLGDGWVEIAEGVARGVQVVTSGLSKLADGTPVVVRADAAPGA